jgi:tetratricopeptide (TPR) repeat protein
VSEGAEVARGAGIPSVGARVQIERALQITEAALGPDHPDVAVWRNNLGRVLQALGDLPSARVQIERALQITEAALGPNHAEVAAWHSNLGGLLRALGDLLGARVEFERALQIGEAALGPNHPTIGTLRSNLGTVLRALGDLPGAESSSSRPCRSARRRWAPTIRVGLCICIDSERSTPSWAIRRQPWPLSPTPSRSTPPPTGRTTRRSLPT